MILTNISELKALSIRQPWPHHIFHNGKPVENRSWKTKFRGEFLIHAGLQVDKNAPGVNEYDFKTGGIVGIATITDCVQELDSEWFFGPNGFILENARPLPFIPCRGKLSFFKPDIENAIVNLWHEQKLLPHECAQLLGMQFNDFVEKYRNIC